MDKSNYTKEDLIKALATLFIDVSHAKRRGMIGAKIDRILASYYDSLSNEHIARALLTLYGSEALLPKTGILEKVINGMDENRVKLLAEALHLETNDPNIYDIVISNIRSKYNDILSFFEQPDFFLEKKEKDDRSVSELISLEYEQPLKSLGYPHPYQNRVKLELEERIRKSSGSFRSLIVMPTGSGKTRTAIEFLIDFVRVRKNSNVLWVVESPSLSEQSLQSFKELWKLRGDREIKVHRCFSRFIPEIELDSGTNIIFGAFDKMNSLREKENIFYKKLRESTNLMIIDEAHFSLAETYEQLITDIELNSQGLCKVGLTATPMRMEDNEFHNLKDYFNGKIIDFKDEYDRSILNPLKYLQDNEYLANLDIEYLSINDDEIHEDSNEFNDKVIERILSSVKEEKQIIVFSRSVDHAIGLNILLQDKGVKSECIIGDTSSNDRLRYFNDFKSKDDNDRFKLNVLINYNILATGIDLPRVDELFLLRKFGNVTTAMQVLGRALRGKNNGGNLRNKVISVKGNKTKISNESDLYNLIKNMH